MGQTLAERIQYEAAYDRNLMFAAYAGDLADLMSELTTRAERAEAERDDSTAATEKAAGVLNDTRYRICRYWQEARLTEGQAAHLLGVDRLEARKIANSLNINPFDEPDTTDTQTAKNQENALAIIQALAELTACGETITLCDDYDYGTMTITRQSDGAHTHVGAGPAASTMTREEAFANLVNSLYSFFVDHTGLSWVKTSQSPDPAQDPGNQQTGTS